MKRILFILLFVVKHAFAFAQSNNIVLSMKRGIIVFEGDYDMYFIETADKDLNALLNTGKDTVFADILHTSAGPYNFKRYLNHTMKFDTATVNIKQEDQLGRPYEEELLLWTKAGLIKYNKSQSYKLKRQHKTIFFNNQSLVISLEDYLPIKMFTDKTSNRKSKRKSRAIH
jgi:hypothetical protein